MQRLILVKYMSIWDKKEKSHKIVSLKENVYTDILIIGGGITGLTTAYYLKDYPSVCLVDASAIGHGVTLNTTAKITYFQERIYTKIAALLNEEKARDYLQSQREAISYLVDIIEKENIACSLTKTPSFVFANTKKEVNYLQKEVEFLKKYHVSVKKHPLPDKITSYDSYCVEDTYVFHPLEYLEGLYEVIRKNGVSIYENSPIMKIEEENGSFICYSNNACIKANKVILACHYPFFLFPFLLPMKSSVEKSYIIVSKVQKDKNYSCISSASPTYSCRFYQKDNEIYQISLSESHNIAFCQNDEKHFKRVKEIFQLNDNDIVCQYSNVDVITNDYIPYIGRIKDNMYIGVGYNTWGMTNGVLAGKILSDLVKNKKNEFQYLMNPLRKTPPFFFKLPYYLLGQTKSFIGPKIKKQKGWYSPRVSFCTKNGKNLAVYIDENKKKHIVYNKCPHLGCSLIFNEVEKTWDCPCHSSRFTIDGECIKGPSTKDISYLD